MNEKQLAFFNSAEAIRQFPDPKARECVALGMKGEGPRVRGVKNAYYSPEVLLGKQMIDSLLYYLESIPKNVGKDDLRMISDTRAHDVIQTLERNGIDADMPIAKLISFLKELKMQAPKLKTDKDGFVHNASPRYKEVECDGMWGVQDIESGVMVKDYKFSEFQAQDMANTMNLKVVKNATDKNFKILQYIIRDWYEVCVWPASSKEEAERQFLAQNPAYKDRSIKAVETKKNGTGTEKAYEIYKGVQIMEDSGIFWAEGNHGRYQSVEELKKAIDETLKSKKNSSSREDLITHIFNLKRLRDGSADYNKVEKDMQGKSDEELKRIIDSMQMTAKNSSPVLKEQFRANGAEMFKKNDSAYERALLNLINNGDHDQSDIEKLASKYNKSPREVVRDLNDMEQNLVLENDADPKTKARALGNALYGPKKNESTKTKDVLVRALKKGDVRWFNDGTSATVKYIDMLGDDKFEIEFDNGKSVIQDGSTYCRVSALNSLDPKTKAPALGNALYGAKSENSALDAAARAIEAIPDLDSMPIKQALDMIYNICSKMGLSPSECADLQQEYVRD